MKWNVSPSSEEMALLIEAGVIYRDAGRLQQAREVFLGVRALTPSSEAAEILLGTVDFAAGDIERASTHYRKALEINPRSALAYAHLGQASMCLRDTAGAAGYCRKALELEPRGGTAKFARAVMDYSNAVQY